MVKNNLLTNFGKNLIKLEDKNNYTKINKNYFENQPNIFGYIYQFKSVESIKIYLIINESHDYKYNKEYLKIRNYIFITFNTTLDNFIENIEDYSEKITDILKPTLEQKEENKEQAKGGLPYGYYKDNDGNIKIDNKKASEVRRIFDMYLSGNTMRDISKQLDTNFSRVHDVITDERYLKMTTSIIPSNKLRQAKRLTDTNRKNRKNTKNKTMTGKIDNMSLDKLREQTKNGEK